MSRPAEPDRLNPTERRELGRFAEGERDAFGKLMRPQLGALRALARRAVGDEHWAEDLLQETLVRAYQGLGAFRGESALRTWLFRILMRLCAEPRRWRPGAPVSSLDGLDIPDAMAASPEQGLRERELNERLQECLERLSPKQRSALQSARRRGHGLPDHRHRDGPQRAGRAHAGAGGAPQDHGAHGEASAAMKPDPSRPGDRFCPYSDAVLALLLDGESDDQFVQEPGWEHGLSATEIARHRLDCPLCAEHIARARHLDALLAGATQIDFDSGEPDELLARVTAAAAEPISAEPTAVRGQGSRLPAGLVAAGLLLLGFFAGSFFWAAPEPLPEGAAGLPAQPEALTTQRELGDSLDPGMIRLPDRNGARAFARRSARQRRNRPLTPAQLVALARGSEVVTLACERYSDLARRSSLPGLWRAAQFLSKLGDAIMLHSIGELVDSTEAKARRMTIAALTDWPDGIALRSLLAQARDEVGLRTLLVRGAKDPQLLRAAARLGGVKLDQRLRSSAADSPGMLGKLVAALASLRERPGRVALLLDLWGDLAIKDGNLDDLALAKGWFSALPFPSGAEICEEFVRSRNAGSRRQCLLALAAQGRSSQSEFLQRIVAGPRLEESELAAYALGQIPAGADGLDERIDGNRRAYLLLTALACREDQRLSPIIERMELSEAERRFLAAGAFTLEQFDIAASLFRNRRSLAGL